MAEWLTEGLAWKGVAVGIWVAGFAAAERLWPAVPRPDVTKRLGRNLGLWLINTGLSPLIVLPLTAWAAGNSLLTRPSWWQGLAGLGLDLFLLDMLIYWWHRANHEVRFLWRFHAVHHLDATLDVSSAVRFHFGEVLLSAAARACVIVALGFPFSSVLVFEVLVLAAAIFHHSKLSLPAPIERGLALLIVTPSIHWVHHHRVRADTDSNYATILSVWDKIFGSRSRTQRTTSMPIGVEGEAELALAQLLLRPFGLARAAAPKDS
jgi:sterol desaturase/sphingolipid hydroxylase (fatty acid hydroxylase superfamily)